MVTSSALDDGILPVDKPVGPTSHDIVARVRRVLGVRKVGHTGTLDPFASGLLLLCLGSSTRLAQYLSGLPKEYEAEARLGQTTDTDDLEGGITGEDEGWRALDRGVVEEALSRFQGTTLQRPPPFSAKKVRGEAAHRRVRRGEEVQLEPVEVEVEFVELLELDLPRLRFRVRCSAGTYIRAIARDLGEALGVGGHLSQLRRTGVGGFRVAGALALEELEDLGAVTRARIPPVQALAHLPQVQLQDPDEVKRLRHGREIGTPGSMLGKSGPVVLARGEEVVAVGVLEGASIRPRKVFAS